MWCGKRRIERTDISSPRSFQTLNLMVMRFSVPSAFFLPALRRVVGGMAALFLPSAPLFADPNHEVVETSNPSGLIAQRLTAVAEGATHRVHDFPMISGSQRFGFWTFNGVRQSFPNGQAYIYPELAVTEDIEAIAHFFPVSQDGDGDRLADWWEYWMFSDRSRGPQDDEDGDGVTHEQEFRFGYSARFQDVIPGGGISSRLSAPLRLIVRNRFTYTLRSEPRGLVSAEGELNPGHSYTTPYLIGESSGFTFVGYQVDGQPLHDVTGCYLNRITVVPAANTEIVARYVRTGEDSDEDGILDVVEYQNFNTLVYGKEDDPDGDGFSIGVEIAKGLSVTTPDLLASGGISSRLSAPLEYDRVRVRYVMESRPLGLLTRAEEMVAAGTPRTSPHVGTGLVAGFAFGYWSVNGVRIAEPGNVARRQVNVTVDGTTTLVAHFFDPGADVDEDDLPDLWEWNHFGTLENDLDSDPDVDGFSIAQERRLGLTAAHVDQLVNGGLSARLSAPLNYETGTRKRLLVRSQPLGIATTTDEHKATGTAIVSAHYAFTGDFSGYQFTHWTRNGQRVADSTGHARAQVLFNLTEDTELVAHFTPPLQDLDEDGIPDVIELRLAENLSEIGPDTDADGDGFAVSKERSQGLSLVLKDQLLGGGISSRLSAPATLQFSIPPVDLLPAPLRTVRGAPAGARVATLAISPVQPGRSYQYALILGEGADDNARFYLAGSELRLASAIDQSAPQILRAKLRVTDDLGVTRDRQLLVQVVESLLAPLGTRVVDEEWELEVQLSIMAPEMADQPAVLTMVSGPAGSTFHSGTNRWSWTPSEADGPGSFDVVFRAENGLMSSEQTLKVSVREVNRPPMLQPAAEKTAVPGQELSFAVLASDPDLPANQLVFSLSGAPAGVEIDAGTGLLTWTPSEAQAGEIFNFGVSVSDGLATVSEPITVRVSATLSAAGTWLEGRFSETTPAERRGLLDDANGDGVSNLMCYAIGLNPETGVAAEALPSLERNPQGMQLIVRVRANDPALSFQIRKSTNLENWGNRPLTFNAVHNGWNVEGNDLAVETASDLGDGIWELRLALAPEEKAFWLLFVDQRP